MNDLKEKIEKVLIMNSGEYLEYSKGQIANELLKPEWISCSEKLPELKENSYKEFIVIKDVHGAIVSTTSIYGGLNGYKCEGEGYSFTFSPGWQIEAEGNGWIKVIAWMELPKPYEIV